MTDKDMENIEKIEVQGDDENTQLMAKIENAYKMCKLSEVYLRDVDDDYGKQKIAALRLEFARHELQTLVGKARKKGLKLKNSDMIMSLFRNDFCDFM